MGEVISLSDACVCCLSHESVNDVVEATMVMLLMLYNGCTAEDMRESLCFEHQHKFEEAIVRSKDD